MATHDYVISNASGAAVRADLNNALAAIVSNNSNATEPSTTYAYQWWADTGSSPAVMKLRNAANNAWITLFQLDGEWSTIALENGTAAAPSLYFKDSGTDTGFFSGGTDQVNVATAGTERVEWGTSEVVFNDGGANYDFRIEGDTNANLFFVDASADAVGIGTTSVNTTLEVVNSSTPIIRVGDGTRHVQLWGGSSTQNQAVGTATSAAFNININSSPVATFDSSGRLLVGTSTAIAALEPSIQTARSSGAFLALGRDDTSITDDELLGAIYFYGNQGSSWSSSARIEAKADAAWGTNDYPSKLVFSTTPDSAAAPVERLRITQDGNALIGTTTNTARLTTASAGSQGTVEVSFLNGGCEFFVNSGGGANAAACVQRIGSNTTSSRSINAGGTINASGTDYAEYMVKAGNFTIAKGAVCGVTADGLLTLDYSDAVSFAVKSTNPSYVGGDIWGSEDAIGSKPDADDTETLIQWEAALEAARQQVDRIAFAGQVPVNVMGATPGQYIVPVEAADGGIEGIAKNEADLTLAEYMRAVGKVIAIEDDGRARIIVKVA